jgi:hypothetical protein
MVILINSRGGGAFRAQRLLDPGYEMEFPHPAF